MPLDALPPGTRAKRPTSSCPPDLERAERIGSYHGNLKTRMFG